MGSKTSTQISISTTPNQEIDQYLQYIGEGKKKRYSQTVQNQTNSKGDCLSCTFCSGLFSKKVNWRKNFSKECSQLKDKFYWAFYLPDLLNKNLDLNNDEIYCTEAKWAIYLPEEDFLLKAQKTSPQTKDSEIPGGKFDCSKNFSFGFEADDFNNSSQKTEKKLENNQNINIFQIKDNLSCIEPNSTILKIDEKLLSVNITAQNDLHEFSCPTKFLTYDENTLVFERNIREGLEENEEFSEVQNLYKRVLAIISKHLKDPKHPLFFLKTEYFHYFMKNYEYLTQMEFRTSTSKNMVACYETMLADIRQFIRLFKESIMNFYSLDEISKSSMQVNLFTNDNMINFVLSILFDDKVYFTIFEIQRKIDRFNEIILKRNLKNLKDFPPERFSVPEKFCLNEKTLISKNLKSKKKIPRTLISNICSPLLNIVNIECSLHKEKDRDHKQFTPFQNTIEMMKNLNYLKSPAHKMKLVIKASENIQDEIEEFYESYGVSEKIVLNPEEFLSIFIYIVSKVKINSLISQCNFMEKFMTQSNLTGKNGYYFYMFKAAVEYVLNETE